MQEDEAAKILQQLREERFLDDRRYAGAFARDKSSMAGWGAAKIFFHLKMKRIDQEIIREALQGVDSSKMEGRMREVLGLKWKQLQKEEDVQKRKMKFLRFATGRGYGYEESLSVLEELEVRP